MKALASGGGQRVVSLDQFRGYTMAGMFLVNFIGGFSAVHDVFKHHNTYNSYADTIMPHFFFAAGFAMRLVALKLNQPASKRQLAMRALGLILLGLVIYHLDGSYKTWEELTRLGWSGFFATSFLRSPFQALVHIGLTCLWVLPVIGRRSRDLVLFGVASGLLHLGFSAWFWFEASQRVRVIDGGALGFLSWTVPTLAGALAYDAVRKFGAAAALRPIVQWGVVVSFTGYVLSCVHGIEAPPFWPPWNTVDHWTMTQRAGSLSYQTFSAGFSLLVYGLFLWLCDVRQPGFASPVLRTFGTNALAGYLIHISVADFLKHFGPRDSPLWYVCFLTAIYMGITWSFIRALERRSIFLRL